ncbi:MAG TPA: nitroreductase family protein [Candidatus Paceibacterota bacterium]|jgi:nitroreductase|nr:nitroreductase family protein [Candidatus Paceibacterota bacterium]
MIESEKLQRILNAAVQAPSGDNSQPWSFWVQGDTLDVHIHPERDHPILNVEDRGTLVSLGAVIENITVAAGAERLDADVSLPLDKETAAVVRFREETTEPHPLHKAIAQRHTNRGNYERSLPAEKLAALLQVSCEGTRIVVVSDLAKIASLARAVSMMEEAALRSKPLHTLFFKSIIWDDRSNADGTPGLYIKTTELPLPVQLLFRLIKFWPIMRFLNAVGFSEMAARSNAAVYASSGAMAAISIDHADAASYVAAGRALQRLWLTATKEGLAAQPLAGLLYLSEFLRQKRQLPMPVELATRIDGARREIDSIFQSEGRTIAMLLRIGKPLKSATARSKRKPPVLSAV